MTLCPVLLIKCALTPAGMPGCPQLHSLWALPASQCVRETAEHTGAVCKVNQDRVERKCRQVNCTMAATISPQSSSIVLNIAGVRGKLNTIRPIAELPKTVASNLSVMIQFLMAYGFSSIQIL
jgi:hypothetical protein